MINENEYLKLKEEYIRLKTAVDELAILDEIVTTLNSTIELDTIVGIVLKKYFSISIVKRA